MRIEGKVSGFATSIERHLLMWAQDVFAEIARSPEAHALTHRALDRCLEWVANYALYLEVQERERVHKWIVCSNAKEVALSLQVPDAGLVVVVFTAEGAEDISAALSEASKRTARQQDGKVH